MKKRKAFLCGLLVIVAGVVIWYCTRRPSSQPTVRPTSVETNQTSSAPAPIQNGQTVAKSAATSNPTPESNPAAWIEKRLKQMEEERQKGLNEWRTPIEFYGKVVDENNNPVEGATVHFCWTDLSPTGNSEKTTTSDSNGGFSLLNTNGKNLITEVSKAGYYEYLQSRAAFTYAGENHNFVPDSANPVIFRLKKKGIAEALVALDKNFQISISGKPLQIDLRTGNVASSGQETVIMEFIKQSPEQTDNRVYDWSFKVTVPNGGLLLTTSEFDFLAPETGYVPSDLVEMKSSLEGKWQNRIKRAYFLKLPDGKFARIILDLMAHNGSLNIQAFVNPSGSRNLEFDASKQIPVKP